LLFSSIFNGSNGWNIGAKNSAHMNDGSLVLTAYAICAVVP